MRNELLLCLDVAVTFALQTPHLELGKCDKRQPEGQWPSLGYASLPSQEPTAQVTVNTEWVKRIKLWKFFPWIQMCHMIHWWLGSITHFNLKLLLSITSWYFKEKKSGTVETISQWKKTAGSDFGSHFFQWLESHSLKIRHESQKDVQTHKMLIVSERMGTQKLPMGLQEILWTKR